MKKYPKLFVFTLVTSLIFVLSGCSETPSEDCSSYVVKNEGLPEFISSVWPNPNAKISQSCFRERGLGVEVLSLVMDIFETDCCSNISSKAEFLIDKISIPSEEILILGDALEIGILDEHGNERLVGPGSYIFQLNPDLDRGKHTATIKITNDVGERFEYIWEFTIK